MYYKASKWHQLYFGAVSNIGVIGHLIQQKKTQCAASEIAVFKTATELSFYKICQTFLFFLLNLIVSN